MLETLGKGGVGVVYRVRDEEMQRDVALKTLRRLSVDDLYHLKAEFRALAGIVHRNLVELHELFVDAEHAYFTMEVVDGLSLVDHLWSDEGDGPAISDAGLARLESLLPQLIEGLSALHRAGRLHRDLKPSNLMVTWEGRAVFLDFGLAIGWGDQRPFDTAPQPDDSPFGTPGTGPYMSPEQAQGHDLSPASDWYSLGVVLYETLTGRLPFSTDRGTALRQQREGAFAPPSTFRPGLPARYDTLVCGLLRPDPAARLGLEALLALVDEGAPTRSALPLQWHVTLPFVGRDAELATLRQAWHEGASGAPVVVRVEGRSGVGKSELIRRFLLDLEASPRTVVLRGRCRPQESVPFRAFDGIIDALSRYLVREPSRLTALDVATRRAVLQLFPTLGRGLSGPEAPTPVAPEIDPRALRELGFAGLRQVLYDFAKTYRVLLSIDDLQWADLDSVALAASLVSEPEVPAAVWVLSYQSELRQEPVLQAFLDALRVQSAGAGRHTIELGNLPHADALRLAASILGERNGHAAESLTAETHGSPFELVTLARAVVEHPGEAPPLAELLTRPLHNIEPHERDLLELAAVAGRPLERSLLLQAAGLGESGRREVSRLVGLNLLRLARTDGRPAVETRHDRIRATLLGATSPERQRHCHRRLAETLERVTPPDVTALAHHWYAAGDLVNAGRNARLAAEKASASLAFDQAAALYTMALEAPPGELPRWRLEARLAEALVGAGRGALAAEAFSRAALQLEAEAPGTEEVLDLRRQAAAQYAGSGRYAEGFRVMREVLTALGVKLPESPRWALASALAGRTRLLFKGTRAPTVRRSVERRQLRRLDAMWSAVVSLSMVEPSMADAVGVSHLLEALELGEPSRVVRALGYEATCEASLGGGFFRKRVRRLLDETEALARDTAVPYDRAWALMARGTSSWFEADWPATVRWCDGALEIYRSACRGVSWEVATSEIYALSALSHLGRIKALSQRMTRVLREAESREDLFAIGGFLFGQQSLHWLAHDKPAEWEALATRARNSWQSGVWHVQRYQHLVAKTQVLLYADEVGEAFALLTQEWPALEAAQLLRLEIVRIELHQLRARAALGLARRGGSASWSVARLHAQSLADARTIAATKLAWSAPLTAMIASMVAHQRRDAALARARAQDAAEGFERCEMALFAAVASSRSAQPDGPLVPAVAQFLRDEGVVRPEALARMVMPG
ncbi:MAG: AAA family ATPase [Myxococcales bacterium]|nr:AAA family ATPase [Myxococcales bacterium]